jgi:hypothetical protein
VVIDYFTKWVEAMPTFLNDVKIMKVFILNYIITRFSLPREITIDHGTNFQNTLLMKLTAKLCFQ